jgi:WD40 repeat protein
MLFFGRDDEIRDLFLRVRDQPLTVLYGQSGLGKTSLLGAGLVPKLKVEGFRPVLLRLAYDSGEPPLLQQTVSAVAEHCNGGVVSRSQASTETLPKGDARPSATLWERFHHIPSRPPDAETSPIVLIFDQFEEIFTLGQSAERQAQVSEFFVQLAELVENRPPAEVQEKWRCDRKVAREYDVSPVLARVVIALREDFLAQLEVWRKTVPSLMRNRMRMEMLNGLQALEAVARPGQMARPPLATEDVAAQIVRFVAQRPPETPLNAISAVPPLLSLVCDELNMARLAAGASTITSDQVKEQSKDILQNFYARSFDGLPTSVQRFVEERFVTTVGEHRNSIARDDAISELAKSGVENPAGAIDHLINRRLLSAEERGGVLRLEITHDVLAPVVVRARDRRQAREAVEAAEKHAREARADEQRRAQLYRTRLAMTIFAVLAGLAVISSFWAWRASENLAAANTRLSEANWDLIVANENLSLAMDETRSRLQEASRFDVATAQARLAEGKWQEGVAYLGRSLHYDHDYSYARDAFWLAGLYGPRDGGQIPVSVIHHNEVVRCACFSPEGMKIVTASGHTARVWDATNGEPVGEALQHRDTVNDVSFSPDGVCIVTAADDEAQVWDTTTFRRVSRPLKHQGTVFRASFSNDGALVVTASRDQTARVWDAATGEAVGKALRHKSAVTDASFSRDGKRIVTASKDHGAQVWDATSREPIGMPLADAHIPPSRSEFPEIKSSSKREPDKGMAREGTSIQGEGLLPGASFSPDGTLIVSVGGDGIARVWSVTTGQPIGEPMRHDAPVCRASFSPDGTRIATAGNDSTAGIWETLTGRPIGERLRHEGQVYSAFFNQHGTRIVTASEDKTARIWLAGRGQATGEPLRHDDAAHDASMNTDGTRVATACSDGTAQLWDPRTGESIGEPMRHADKVFNASFNPDGTRIVTASADRTARLWDTSTGQQVGQALQHEYAVNDASFSPDGRQIVTACSDNRAWVWDVSTQDKIASLPHPDRVYNAVFNPDGKRIATACADKTARIWDAERYRPVSEPLQHEGTVWSVSFNPDGNWILTASDDKTARIWEAATGRQVGDPLRHEAEVFDASFSPDGERVVTASSDNTVRIWDAATHQPIGAPFRHAGAVNDTSFSPDGTRILTASVDRTVRIWDWTPEYSGYPDFAYFLSGVTLDRQLGSLKPLGYEDREKSWMKLERDLAPTPEWLFLAKTAFSRLPDSQLSPGTSMIIREAATRLIRTGQAGCIREALSIDPGHPLVQIALAALNENNVTRAEFLRDYGVGRLPNDAAVCREAADLLIKQKDRVRAALVIDKAGQLDPDHPDLVRLREALERLDGRSTTDSRSTDTAPTP